MICNVQHHLRNIATEALILVKGNKLLLEVYNMLYRIELVHFDDIV